MPQSSFARYCTVRLTRYTTFVGDHGQGLRSRISNRMAKRYGGSLPDALDDALQGKIEANARRYIRGTEAPAKGPTSALVAKIRLPPDPAPAVRRENDRRRRL